MAEGQPGRVVWAEGWVSRCMCPEAWRSEGRWMLGVCRWAGPVCSEAPIRVEGRAGRGWVRMPRAQPDAADQEENVGTHEEHLPGRGPKRPARGPLRLT